MSVWANPTANTEGIDNLANTALMRGCGPLGSLPLVVVSRGRAEAPIGFPAALVAMRERAWAEMQMELAALSSRAVRMIAERSGHCVNQDQPDLVVEAIRHAVALARGDVAPGANDGSVHP